MQKKTLHFFILTILSFFYMSTAQAHYPIQSSYQIPIKISNKSNYTAAIKLHEYVTEYRTGPMQFVPNKTLMLYNSLPYHILNPHKDTLIGLLQVEYLDRLNTSEFVIKIPAGVHHLPQAIPTEAPFFVLSAIDIIGTFAFNETTGFSLEIKNVNLLKFYNNGKANDHLPLDVTYENAEGIVININDMDILKLLI